MDNTLAISSQRRIVLVITASEDCLVLAQKGITLSFFFMTGDFPTWLHYTSAFVTISPTSTASLISSSSTLLTPSTINTIYVGTML